MATIASPQAVVTWASSHGAGKVRKQAVLELHRLHFVEKKGSTAVEEVVKNRCLEGKAADAKLDRQHRQRIQQINAEKDDRLQKQKMIGGMTLRSKEERIQMENARTDEHEAAQKAIDKMKEQAKAYNQQTEAIEARVRAMPVLNFRPVEELRKLDELREDSLRAIENRVKDDREREKMYAQNRTAMTERVKAGPWKTFRTPEERSKIEELRQDPDEATAAMIKNMKELSRTYRDHRRQIEERVSAMPAMSFRSKEEREMIEDARQDPDEAQQKMAKHMKELTKNYKETMKGIDERVQSSPKKTFWTPEERDRIEELRQDPIKARAKAKEHMSHLAQSWREQKNAIDEKVASIPKQTFLSQHQREQRDEAEKLRLSRTKRKP